MDKTKWPQYMKDQYNSVIRRRKRIAAVADEIHCPKLHEKEISEETVFGFLAYGCKFHHVINKIFQKYISENHGSTLQVSNVYLYFTRKIFPGYYSDRERMVAMLNRYKQNENFEDFLSWTDYFSSSRYGQYIHLMIGVFILDIYLQNLKNFQRLNLAIIHLEKAQKSFKLEGSKLAFNTLLAFCYYLREDFDSSVRLLNVNEEKRFHQDFVELIRKAA